MVRLPSQVVGSPLKFHGDRDILGTITSGTAELWLGNDRDPGFVGGDVIVMEVGGNVLTQIPDTPTTRIAPGLLSHDPETCNRNRPETGHHPSLGRKT